MIATSTDVKKISASAKNEKREELSASSWRKGQGAPAQTATARAVPAGKETVLLVDCSLMMRGILARALRQLGYHVVEASGTLEAQRLAASCREIRLLLVDHSRPDLTDMELALWFRAMYPKMKILVACVSLWDLNLHVGETQQINFLAKPFTERELARIVRRVLEH
jgi:DNA-binding NtrC family response regulator